MGVWIKLHSPITAVLHGGYWSTSATDRHGSKANDILKMEDLVGPGTELGVVATIKFLSMTGIESQSSTPQPVTLLTQAKNGVDKTTHILKLI